MKYAVAAATDKSRACLYSILMVCPAVTARREEAEVKNIPKHFAENLIIDRSISRISYSVNVHCGSKSSQSILSLFDPATN